MAKVNQITMFLKTKPLVLFILLFFCSLCTWAQGVNGHVRTPEQEILPFATIYVKELATGTTSNANGYFEIKLAPGTYHLVFHYLGYAKHEQTVEVGQEFQPLEIILKPQAMLLQEYTHKARGENPAYTIMRKAIAKAGYHRLLVQKYQARVYIKGSGKLTGIPFYAKSMMKKEGVEENKVYLVESISDLSFEQPNTYKETVLSVQSNEMDSDQSVSPMQYVQSSFYEEKVVEAVSPLSPKAFSYYKFELIGSFYDNGREVNKIKVIPRNRGEGVFEGVIYINEDLWNIHSLKLSTSQKGFKINMEQIYAAVKENAWMPVSYTFDVSGSILGFDLEGAYVAALSNYVVALNPDLNVPLTVIDEKVEKAAPALPGRNTSPDMGFLSDTTLFNSDSKVTRRQLRKSIRKYEKEVVALEKQDTLGDVIEENRTMIIDSLARKKDAEFWAAMRPVPLSEVEMKSYAVKDSLIIQKAVADTTQTKDKNGKPKRKRKYYPERVVTGGTYNLNKKNSFTFEPFLKTLAYNTVEGFNARMEMTYHHKGAWYTAIKPTLRYGISSEEFYGSVLATFHHNTQFLKKEWEVEAGHYIYQINEENPIPYWLNSFISLVYERNFAKLYEKDFVRGKLNYSLNDQWTGQLHSEWEQRTELFNTNFYSLFDWEKRSYTPNRPLNDLLPNTGFATNRAMKVGFQLAYEPIVKYRKYNGYKTKIEDISPVIKMKYEKGINGLLGSSINYDFLEFSIEGKKRNVGRLLHYYAGMGGFLNNRNMSFVDYKHFYGNQTYLFFVNKIDKFRLLDYYRMSTNGYYAQVHANQQFRRLLFTNVAALRVMGIHEDLYLNHLHTNNNGYFSEVGYAIDGIWRLFRVEVTAGFRDGRYETWGFRAGMTKSLEFN